jgi:hypothetical protein
MSSSGKVITIPKTITLPKSITGTRAITGTTTKTGLITSTITTPIISPITAPFTGGGYSWTGAIAPIIPIGILPPYIPRLTGDIRKKGPTRKIKGIGAQFIGSSYAAKVFDIRSSKEAKGSFGGMFTGLEIKPLTLGGIARVRKKGSKPIENGKTKKKTKKKSKR